MLLIIIFATGQTYKTGDRVWISKSRLVKVKATKEKEEILLKDAIGRRTIKGEVNGEKYDIEIVDTFKTSTKYKTITSNFVEANLRRGYWANVSPDKETNQLHVNFWLSKDLDKEHEYVIEFGNREYVSLPEISYDFGPITIPFKYRFGYSTGQDPNKKVVSSEFAADANIGIFGGVTIGRYRTRYETGSGFKDLSRIHFTIGGFLNLSTTNLDSLSTTAGNKPFGEDEEKTIGVLSPGLGIMGVFYNVQVGAFIGWDCGISPKRKSWNFNNKPWFGIGLGYDLSALWSKK